MASWLESAAVAHAPARAPARARPKPKAKPRPTPKRSARRRQRGVAGGVAWIVVAGVLLAGIVALNVAVLRLNVKLDRLNTDREQLRGGNAALASQLSSAAASPRIENLAKLRLGVVPADPTTTTYLDVSPHSR
jgi:outer membrane murein-binding lipoprotein Lpp